jgi:hypothetical protein
MRASNEKNITQYFFNYNNLLALALAFTLALAFSLTLTSAGAGTTSKLALTAKFALHFALQFAL